VIYILIWNNFLLVSGGMTILKMNFALGSQTFKGKNEVNMRKTPEPKLD